LAGRGTGPIDWAHHQGAIPLSNTLKFISMAGALVAIILLVLIVISIFGGFEATFSNPPS